jgi:hypothetical protein
MVVAIKTSSGIQVAVKQHSSTWVNGSVNTDTSSRGALSIATTYQLGSLTGVDQFTGNISLFETLLIPDGLPDPLAWAKQQWGIE